MPAAAAGEPERGASRERRWEVEFTPEVRAWLRRLDQDSQMRFLAAVTLLERSGPTLGRPAVDSIRRARHHNMKELRVVRRNLRALFVFDPRQRAIVLVGGEKTGNWKGWYRTYIPRAEKLYDRHLRAIGEGDRCRPGPRAAGRNSSPRGR
jgi:hypothetical protein